ncbi:FAD-binding oxidoreductase [Microlunatus speluncae]|uniref:FAD-binding oxidoreductase n=1 Tax=Microlunatus speluncae TaxID=2594267 RepID=UPI0012664879|nr:FAD-binding oxidoreductase [Microlunatus speluncae]
MTTDTIDVIRPGDPGYDDHRTGFQTFRPLRPDLIATPSDTEELTSAVRYARDQGLPIAVQATGHGTPGRTDGGLLINTTRLTGVEVDPERRTAWVAAGTRWDEVVAATAAHGLAGLAGNARSVGVISYALGGGIGPIARRYGFAADHVHRIELITADGERTMITADSDPDLFWAVRGGGGNFGVVAGIEIGLFEQPHLFGGSLFFDTPLLESGLKAWREWLDTVPDEITSTAVMVPLPDLPVLPPPLRGRHVLSIRVTSTGPADQAEELVRPLQAIGEPLLGGFRVLPYAEIATINNDPTDPAPHRNRSTLLSDLDQSMITELVTAVGPGAAVPTVFELRHLGGALAQPPAVPNAVGNRTAGFSAAMINGLSSADPEPAELDRVAAHQGRVLAQLSGRSAGRLFTFLGGTAGPDDVRAAFDPDAWDRLTKIKSRVDPGNVFRYNANIPPSA